MKLELTKWNFENVCKVLNEKITADTLITIDETYIKGVRETTVEVHEVDIPKEQRENGEEDYIEIELLFDGGKVSKSFCPDREVCFIFFDFDGGITIEIQDTKKYIEREKSLLNDRLEEYERYMNQ